MKMRKTLLILAAAATMAASAQSQFANPKDADGNIIFKYDMVNDRWADANDFEIDETFVFAIDITGVTDANGKVLTEEVAKTGRASIGRGIAFDCWVDQDNYPTGSKGPNFDGRLFKIKDNIWGMTFNIFQFLYSRMKDDNMGPNDDYTEYKVQEAGFRFGFSGCVFIYGHDGSNPGAEWWDGVVKPVGFEETVVTMPYTGTKTSPEYTFAEIHPEEEDIVNMPAGCSNAAFIGDNWGGYAYPQDYAAAIGNSGIEDVTIGTADIVAREYYDVNGRKLNDAPASGFYIVRQVRADGTADAIKAVR